jgi:hypothetical protein
LAQARLQPEQLCELLWICHWRFAGEIFADVSGCLPIDRRHGANRFILLAKIFLAFRAIR